MDYRDLAARVLGQARATGASAADLLVSEGTEFSVSVRRQEVETLKEAGSRALGLRVFVGRRTASSHTSDLSRTALERLVEETVAMARATGEDPAAGLPDEMVPVESPELDLFDPSPGALPTDERIGIARRAEAAALGTPGITNSQGASYRSAERYALLANTAGFVGDYRTSSVTLSVVPQAEKDGQMERDYWYTTGRGLTDLEPPDAVGRTAALRTLRRLGARQAPTGEVPVVFDPEAAGEILGTVFSALSGYAIFRGASFLRDRLGEAVASPLLTLVDDARRPRGLGSRPFDGEGLPTRRNVPLERGVLRHWLCDSYAARKLGTKPTGSARRGVSGGPSVGSSNLCFEPGTASSDEIVAGVVRGLYVTDLIGFGVNVVTGDYSQGVAGHWIENGRLVHPVHETTIAGNLKDMLVDIDAVGDDLVWRGSSASPTLRIRRMTVSGRR
jgi:PmbA protein